MKALKANARAKYTEARDNKIKCRAKSKSKGQNTEARHKKQYKKKSKSKGQNTDAMAKNKRKGEKQKQVPQHRLKCH